MQFHRLTAAIGLILATTTAHTAPIMHHRLSLEVIGQYQTGVFDEGAAEIVVHDSRTQRLFVINADAASVDVLDINDPTQPVPIGRLPPAPTESEGEPDRVR